MRFAGFEASVSADGCTVTVADEAGPLVALAFVLPGDEAPGFAPELPETAMRVGEGFAVRLRMDDADESLRIRLSVDNVGAESLRLPYLGLVVAPQPERWGWAWHTDRRGAWAFGGADAILGVSVRGYLEPVPALPFLPDAASSAQTPKNGVWHLAPPGGRLPSFHRHQVEFELRRLERLGELGAMLPAWLPESLVPRGVEVALDLPDSGLTGRRDVDLTADAAGRTVALRRRAGHGLVAVHGPRHVEEVSVSWWPSLEELLPRVVSDLLRTPPSRASGAAGVLVAEALLRALAPDADAARDWLEAADWAGRPGLLGVAAAGLAGAASGEPAALDDAWRLLGDVDIAPGFGLVVMRLWLAWLSATGEPRGDAAGLLRRPTDDEDAAVELALLSDRERERCLPALRWWIDALGGGLPGRPIGVDAVAAAQRVGLLQLCPEEWPISTDAAPTAEHTRCLLLADYADDPLGRDLDALAWLCVGELGV